METNVVGGFTPFRSLDEEEEKMFEAVMGHIVGTDNKPLAVATQTVRGTNYAFLCVSNYVIAEENSHNSLVIINKPLPQENRLPMLLEIKTVKFL